MLWVFPPPPWLRSKAGFPPVRPFPRALPWAWAARRRRRRVGSTQPGWRGGERTVFSWRWWRGERLPERKEGKRMRTEAAARGGGKELGRKEGDREERTEEE